MTRAEKEQQIAEISEVLANYDVVYLADTSELDAETTSLLRRECFKNDISVRVVKNTLLRIAIERAEGKNFGPLTETLKGQTSLMTSSVGNVPAKLIKDFRKKSKSERPILKGAYVEEACFIGNDQLEALANIKSKEELLGEIIGLLQSPAKNVISALKSGGNTIAGLVKTLQEREA